MKTPIPPERKRLFTIGTALLIFGALLFGSTFVSFFLHFGEFDPGPSFGKSIGLRAFSGIILIGVGNLLRTVAARGLAGSGVVLDPQQARRDLEPWSRMGGGMVKDALEEVQTSIPETTAPLSLEERLRRLRDLQEKGLISEAEYAAQRQRILESA
ncbi:MAG TPA: SHOCT domain-containing protein [Chthoniobacteraceae bacterium]|nr:SHOCT domain-containing protein [Chthoniobacteraceae bacterium]